GLAGEVAAMGDFDEGDLVASIGTAEMIHKGLAKLTALHREVVTLRFLEEMPLDEIAEIVGCSPGTVKSRLHYALKNLREQIRERADV
ncbi:MAG: RNA polymerase sigma factor, partial [Planctomycetaceae bacterium]